MPAMMKDRASAGPACLGGGEAGEHENAGADDAADAEQRQLRGAERAAQLVAGGFLLVQLGDGLGGKIAGSP